MAEMLAFPLLFLLSLLFFRSLVASVLPLMIGGLAIVGTFLILRIASEFGSISIFALNLTTALGLGLAIDYSLFIVSRYREEIAKDGPGLAAMRRVLATSGRTVFFSSLTVVRRARLAARLPSALPLLDGPRRRPGGAVRGADLTDRAAGGADPARLRASTPARRASSSAAPKPTPRSDENGFWYRLSRFVMRRPLPVATFSALLLIVIGLPFLGIKFNTVDPTVLPESASARAGLRHRQQAVPALPRDADLGRRRRRRAEGRGDCSRPRSKRVPGVAEVLPPQRLRGGVTALQAISANPFVSDASQETVKAIRGAGAAARGHVMVSGGTADFIDLQSSLARHLPIALAIVIVATLVILFLMTGSVILPIKSLIMNFLNLSAVFGLLVLIFQDGRLEGILDYTCPGAIEQTMPILLFAVAFGLSTDYAVFLLSRIKEARDNGASDSECVAIGLERTGRIVTAAALLFAVAMGAFATSQIIFIKENGVGTALAVLIDASIVRALLVPSLMELLGKWNWWAPAPLRRLHERFGISERGRRSPPSPSRSARERARPTRSRCPGSRPTPPSRISATGASGPR